MKGLLIKDLKLMLGQKRFLLIVFGMGLMLMFTNEQPSSAIGYITMLLTVFTLSTISYDEHENGMNFLLTLPIGRKTYVQEKYLFAGFLALASSVAAVLLAYAAAVTRNIEQSFLEIAVTGAIMLLVALVILAFTLPLQIKFGVEKGRMALFVVCAVIGIVGALSIKLAEEMGVELEQSLDAFFSQSIVVIVLLTVFASILVFLASYFASVRIINKKEY